MDIESVFLTRVIIDLYHLYYLHHNCYFQNTRPNLFITFCTPLFTNGIFNFVWQWIDHICNKLRRYFTKFKFFSLYYLICKHNIALPFTVFVLVLRKTSSFTRWSLKPLWSFNFQSAVIHMKKNCQSIGILRRSSGNTENYSHFIHTPQPYVCVHMHVCICHVFTICHWHCQFDTNKLIGWRPIKMYIDTNYPVIRTVMNHLNVIYGPREFFKKA